LLAEKMGAALTKAIVSGKGKPGADDTFKAEPKGIKTALEGTQQIVDYSGEKPSYEDLTKAMAKIHSTYKNGAVIYANVATIWEGLANIVDGNILTIFNSDVTSGVVGRIFVLEVKEKDAVADGE